MKLVALGEDVMLAGCTPCTRDSFDEEQPRRSACLDISLAADDELVLSTLLSLCLISKGLRLVSDGMFDRLPDSAV